jgi:hypothetical protein
MFDGLDYVTCDDEPLEMLVENLPQVASVLKATYFLDTSFMYCFTVFKPIHSFIVFNLSLNIYAFIHKLYHSFSIYVFIRNP